MLLKHTDFCVGANEEIAICLRSCSEDKYEGLIKYYALNCRECW